MMDVEGEVDEALSMQLCDIVERAHNTHSVISQRLGTWGVPLPSQKGPIGLRW
jgi:hypothetical protein